MFLIGARINPTLINQTPIKRAPLLEQSGPYQPGSYSLVEERRLPRCRECAEPKRRRAISEPTPDSWPSALAGFVGGRRPTKAGRGNRALILRWKLDCACIHFGQLGPLRGRLQAT